MFRKMFFGGEGEQAPRAAEGWLLVASIYVLPTIKVSDLDIIS